MSITALQEHIRKKKTPLALGLGPEANRLPAPVVKRFTDLYGESVMARSEALRYHGTQLMAHLNVKTGCRSRTEAAHKPRSGLYQAYSRRSLGTQTAHHRRVYILHHGGSELRQNGGHGKTQHQTRLLAERHRLAMTYHGEQSVFLSVKFHRILITLRSYKRKPK